jgi:flagellar basal-body rod protein FlgG
MLRSLWTAASGMSAQKLNMDIISNNLANVNTSGFKKSRADFEDLLYQTLKSPGADTSSGGQIPTGIQVGMGTRNVSVQKIFTQGDFTETESEYDMAIEGKGFFKILSNGEEAYTRSGSFKLDSEGYLVTSNGDRLQPEIQIPSNTATLTIDSGGMLVGIGSDGTTQTAGPTQITIYNFTNPSGLKSMGYNKYVPTDASGSAVEGNPGVDGLGTISQGWLEGSNVDVVTEMVNMISCQRAYETASKSIKAADDMMQIANNIRS